MIRINKIIKSAWNKGLKIRRTIPLIMAGVIISQISWSQKTSYPGGGYKSYAELTNKQPSVPYVFTIKKRTKGAKFMVGGAEYRIYCNDGSLTPIVAEKELYAVSTGDTLYLNCFVQKAQTWYAKVITEGYYMGFWGPLNNGEIDNLRYSGYDGSARSEESNTQNPKTRLLYVVDNASGIAKPLNRVMLKKMLAPYPELQQRYLNEPEMEDDETMLNYLIMINSYAGY